MNYDLIIVRYGEIGVKSPKIRSKFERKLIKNIKTTIKSKIDINQGRIYVKPENFNEAMEKLKQIFGIVSFSPAITTKTIFEELDKTLTQYSEKLQEEKNYR